MTNDSFKAWIDAMPIDDVRRRIERLERKLSDLHVLERIHAERHGEDEPAEPAEQAEEAEEAAPSEGGAPEPWAQEGAPEHEHG
jgi:hypothetical protein